MRATRRIDGVSLSTSDMKAVSSCARRRSTSSRSAPDARGACTREAYRRGTELAGPDGAVGFVVAPHRAVLHLSARAGVPRVDDLAAADVDRDVRAEVFVVDDVAGLHRAQGNLREARVLRGRRVRKRNAGLCPCPHREAGAVEGRRPGGAEHIRRADYRLCGGGGGRSCARRGRGIEGSAAGVAAGAGRWRGRLTIGRRLRRRGCGGCGERLLLLLVPGVVVRLGRGGVLAGPAPGGFRGPPALLGLVPPLLGGGGPPGLFPPF